MSTTGQKKKNERRRARRGAYFKQKLEGLHVTHGEFTDLVNKKIKNHSYRLSDSKKISDWIATGIPGPRTPMKARMRQLAVIDVFKIQRNSDEHKMLDGRLAIPIGHLDIEIESNVSASKDTAPPNPGTDIVAPDPKTASPATKSANKDAFVPSMDKGAARKQSIGLYASIITIMLVFILGAVGIGYVLQSSQISAVNEQGSSVEVASSGKTYSFIQCPNENTYRSSPSTAATRVELINKLEGSPRLIATWIDFQGKHIDHLELTDTPVQLQTYTGHGWLFKNEKGECYSEPFFASNQSRQYILR